MKSTKSITIRISNPCNEDWDMMSDAEGGRFCGQCCKTVVDCTGYSDSQLYQFLTTNKGKVCGRYFVSQTARPIEKPYPAHRRWHPGAMALGLTLLFTYPASTYAKPRPPFTFQNFKSIHSKNTPTPPDSNGISGSVHTMNFEQDSLVAHATVVLLRDEKEIARTTSDEKGQYSFYPLEAGNYEICAYEIPVEKPILKHVTVVAGTMTYSDIYFYNKRMIMGDSAYSE